MNCPHCEKPLPENYSASYCPYCGKEIQPQATLPGTPPPRPPTPVGINWMVFLGIILAAPLLTLLSAFLGRGHSGESVSPVIGFFGGIAGGITGGIMLALRIGKTAGARVALGILFACVLAVVCITLSLFGCMAGGYQMNLR